MAWWLAYEELYGDMDKEYPIMSDKKDKKDELGVGEEIYEDLLPTGWDQPGAADTIDFNVSSFDDGTLNLGYPYGSASPDTINLGGSHLPGGMGEDHISISGAAGTAYDDPKYYASAVDFAVDSMGSSTKPQPDLKYKSQKYQEDKGIADLKDYVSSTYRGHYTNKNSDTQTLDLIHSVGDAEAFCRSNALKYLSRYDKKGSAKQDILKAMHYCLLLYYFSGNTKEPDYTNTRYETF